MENARTQFLAYEEKVGNRRALYQVVAQAYDAKSALYPGSHIDISPSLVIPHVTYVDNFQGAVTFFRALGEIKTYIEAHKTYGEDSQISFLPKDYTSDLAIDQVDLIISQFAGFVGQATKKCLREGGILLCNDSHGDATMAYLDEDFDFVGVVDAQHRILTTDLDGYFTFARPRAIDVDKVKKTMKGPKYKKQAHNYLFMYRAHG